MYRYVPINQTLVQNPKPHVSPNPCSKPKPQTLNPKIIGSVTSSFSSFFFHSWFFSSSSINHHYAALYPKHRFDSSCSPVAGNLQLAVAAEDGAVYTCDEVDLGKLGPEGSLQGLKQDVKQMYGLLASIMSRSLVAPSLPLHLSLARALALPPPPSPTRYFSFSPPPLSLSLSFCELMTVSRKVCGAYIVSCYHQHPASH